MFSRTSLSLLLLFFATCAGLRAQPGAGPANVLVVVNDRSSLSRSIGEYYVRKRGIPLKNLCRIQSQEAESIARSEYDRTVATPIAACLRREQLVEQVLYIVLAQGVPLKVDGRGAVDGDIGSVDSELALLYSDLHSGKPHAVNGPINNPFFGKSDARFSHPEFPIYLVTRLAAYDFAGVKALVDKALLARNRGKFVIDMKSDDDQQGNNWLRDAMIRLPKDRVVFDDSSKVLYKQTDVIGFASWGSNDKNRHERYVGFQWLPGAIATEFVSTNGRTFARPPKGWTISDWASSAKWFAGSPQTMTADYLEEGASAATGHVDEPYLAMTPHPDLLLPAYFKGRTLAESYYLSIPVLSWQNIVVGDPLMTLGPPGK
ncbi:MAG: TIGR03790 family protein [Bryobacteraceae bacterium]